MKRRDKIALGLGLGGLAVVIIVATAGSSSGASGAKLKIIDRTGSSPASKRKKTRDLATLDAVVFHQMGFSRGSDPTRYDGVTAHFAVLHDGTVLQLHPIASNLMSSNKLNSRSVAIEFAGNMPSRAGSDDPKHFYKPEKFGQDHLTPAQAHAGRELVRHIDRQLRAGGGRLRHVFAHRQAYAGKSICPGPEVWQQVAEPLFAQSNLDSGGPNFHLAAGSPIPDHWRTAQV